MAVTTISVSTTVPEKTALKSSFDYDIPASIEEAYVRFPKSPNGDDQVYELFKSALTIALQAPARKYLAECWDEISDETKVTLVVPAQGENGVASAVLSEDNQKELQSFMSVWVPGQKSTRTRTLRPVDPVKALMDSWDHLSSERQAEIMSQISAKFPQPSAETRRRG